MVINLKTKLYEYGDVHVMKCCGNIERRISNQKTGLISPGVVTELQKLKSSSLARSSRVDKHFIQSIAVSRQTPGTF